MLLTVEEVEMSALVVQAFQNDLPQGNEYKYEDAYVLIEAEIDKSTSVSSEIGTDWQIVVSGAEAILTEHSKDLKLAVWWLFGLWRLEGLAGLQRGLPVFTQLLTTFTTSLYPKSMRVKSRTAAWLETSLSDELLNDEAQLLALENSKELLEQLKAVEQAVQQACGHDEMFCRRVQRVLERRVNDTKVKAEKVEKAAAPQVKQRQETVAPIQPTVTVLNSDNDAAKVIQSMKKSADTVAKFKRQERFADIMAIRLNRFQSWLEVDALPMNDAGKSMLNPPSETNIENIAEQIDEQAYASAFEKLEGMLKFSPFWFDGHHMAYKLLHSAGEEGAALEVKQALLHFTALYPEAFEFTFNDGTPFASKPTRVWLTAGATVAVVETATEQESAEETRSELIQRVRTMVKKNSLKEAMGVLQSCYQQADNNIERFQWRLTHAEIAVECGRKEIALALLEDLEEKIRQHRLDEWQPELAIQVYVLYLKSFNRTEVELAKLDAIYGCLCKIDSTHAVDIKY